MSSVYRAYDPQLRRDVAVKLIHPHLFDNPKFVHRFEEEAAAVARLRHPNIRQVFDSGHDGESFYMVLEFLPGETLKERLNLYTDKRQLMPLGEVIAITQGEAILTDFGIAKMVGIKEFTATGAVIGTAAYISPEQTQGEGVDHRTDIYAIAVMLYEIVSGAPPFEADSVMSLMMKHINEPVPDLLKKIPSPHPRMITIIEKALAKEPAQRYQTADEIATELSSLSAPKSSIMQETLIENTLIEKIVPDATTQQDAPPSPAQPLLQTFLLPTPEPEKKQGLRR
jgi:serine/threonine-protein kinase